MQNSNVESPKHYRRVDTLPRVGEGPPTVVVAQAICHCARVVHPHQKLEQFPSFGVRETGVNHVGNALVAMVHRLVKCFAEPTLEIVITAHEPSNESRLHACVV